MTGTPHLQDQGINDLSHTEGQVLDNTFHLDDRVSVIKPTAKMRSLVIHYTLKIKFINDSPHLQDFLKIYHKVKYLLI